MMLILPCCYRERGSSPKDRFERWPVTKEANLADVTVGAGSGDFNSILDRLHILLKGNVKPFPFEPPYSDEEAEAFMRRKAKITFPTTTRIANRIIGIDNKTLGEQGCVSSTSGDSSGRIYHLSPHYDIVYRYKIRNFKAVQAGQEKEYRVQLVEIRFVDSQVLRSGRRYFQRSP
jgi:hypothetical protein